MTGGEEVEKRWERKKVKQERAEESPFKKIVLPLHCHSFS